MKEATLYVTIDTRELQRLLDSVGRRTQKLSRHERAAIRKKIRRIVAKSVVWGQKQ